MPNFEDTLSSWKELLSLIWSAELGPTFSGLATLDRQLTLTLEMCKRGAHTVRQVASILIPSASFEESDFHSPIIVFEDHHLPLPKGPSHNSNVASLQPRPLLKASETLPPLIINTSTDLSSTLKVTCVVSQIDQRMQVLERLVADVDFYVSILGNSSATPCFNPLMYNMASFLGIQKKVLRNQKQKVKRW